LGVGEEDRSKGFNKAGSVPLDRLVDIAELNGDRVYYSVVLAWSAQYVVYSVTMHGDLIQRNSSQRRTGASKGPFELGGIRWEPSQHWQ